MKAKLILMTVGVVLSIYLLTGVNVVCAGTLSPRDEQTIKVAYINGFVAAISMDNETIMTLKKDENLLRQTVQNSLSKYLKRVQQMNK